MEDEYMFRMELDRYFASRHTERLELWHLLEARYPELLADWLTEHPEFSPPPEEGIRIGKRPDHLKGGRRNLGWMTDYPIPKL
jgi:hypothetical protein